MSVTRVPSVTICSARGRHAFLTKAIERGIPTLDDTPEDMYRDLGQVADLLQDPRLAAALQVAQAQLETNRT